MNLNESISILLVSQDLQKPCQVTKGKTLVLKYCDTL